MSDNGSEENFGAHEDPEGHEGLLRKIWQGTLDALRELLKKVQNADPYDPYAENEVRDQITEVEGKINSIGGKKSGNGQ